MSCCMTEQCEVEAVGLLWRPTKAALGQGLVTCSLAGSAARCSLWHSPGSSAACKDHVLVGAQLQTAPWCLLVLWRLSCLCW